LDHRRTIGVEGSTRMRFYPRLIFAAFACVGIAVGVIYWLLRVDPAERTHSVAQITESPNRPALSSPYPGPELTTFPDPTASPGSSTQIFIDRQSFDGLIAAVTTQFTDTVHDQSSLDEYRQAIAHRAERARSQLREQIALLHLPRVPTADQASQALL